MWKNVDKEKAPVWEFLGWGLLLWIFSTCISLAFESAYEAGVAGGPVTAGYIIYVINGIFVDTPTPMLAVYVVLKRHHRISSVKDFIALIIRTPERKKVCGILLLFCMAAMTVAVLYGNRNDAAWYWMVLAYPILIIGGGVEEIGWRGFLQPQLEQRFPFMVATMITALIWISWHLILWVLPSSRHYGDSIWGFMLMFISWSFIGAAIYKATKSVLVCVLYHAFINSIGAIYDWNALFDAWPNKKGMYVYFILMVATAILLWTASDQKEKKKSQRGIK